jgi:hypothetical protein
MAAAESTEGYQQGTDSAGLKAHRRGQSKAQAVDKNKLAVKRHVAKVGRRVRVS